MNGEDTYKVIDTLKNIHKVDVARQIDNIVELGYEFKVEPLIELTEHCVYEVKRYDIQILKYK